MERRLAAVHEAGHLVMARRFGFHILAAWITPNPEPAADEKTWRGSVQIYGKGSGGNEALRDRCRLIRSPNLDRVTCGQGVLVI